MKIRKENNMSSKKKSNVVPICYVSITTSSLESITKISPVIQKAFDGKALIIPVLNGKPAIDVKMIDVNNNTIRNVFKE